MDMQDKKFEYLDIDEMIHKSIDLQRGLLDLPDEVHSGIDKVKRDILDGSSMGKAPDNIGDHIFSSGDWNVIPSKKQCICRGNLLSFCYDQDKLEECMLEVLDHAAKKCEGICKRMYLITTHWDSRVAKKYEGYIHSVRKNNIKIYFIHITDIGMAIMPS